MERGLQVRPTSPSCICPCSTMFSPCLSPSPRPFNHTNRSNPSITWGGKYENQCTQSINLPPNANILLGDSHLERLARPAHSSLLQEHLPDWINFGIGGDRVEHVAWRALHGACPDSPANILLWMGSNNLQAALRHDSIESTANTIINLVRSVHYHFYSTNIQWLGSCPKDAQAGLRLGCKLTIL